MSHKRITTQDFERRVKSQMKQENKDREIHRQMVHRANTRAFCEADKRVNALRRLKKNEIIKSQQNDIDRYNERKQNELNRKKEEQQAADILREIQTRKQESQRKASSKNRVRSLCQTTVHQSREVVS
eukprot:1047460_1